MSYEMFKGGHRSVVEWKGDTLFCYHETVIVAKLSDGAIQLNTGGWDTVTTWKYIGIALREYGGLVGRRIEFKRDKKTGAKIVMFDGNEFAFKDNIVIGRRPGWDIDVTEVNSDYRGCPRYVVHFTNLLTDIERKRADVDANYALALRRAGAIGGRKFHNKQFGGGVVFAEHLDKNQIAEKIAKLVAEAERQGN